MVPRLLATLVAVLAAALVGAASAGAAPRLVVESGSGLAAPAAVRVELAEPDGIGALTLLVPSGYAVDLGGAPGARLGSATATVGTAGAEAAVEGALTVADPSGTACPVSAGGAVWLLDLRGAGVDLALRLAAAPVAAGSAESPGAAYRVTLCEPVPAGLELLRLSFALDRAVTAPAHAGRYAWRALVTPLGADEPVEARSVTPLPVVLTLSGRYSRERGAARLQGKLEAGGTPVADVRVSISSGRSASSLRPTLNVRTGAKGGYEATKGIRAATSFRAAVDTVVRESAACLSPVVPGGCASETEVIASATSRTVRVTVPPPPVLQLGSRGAAVRDLERRLVELHYLPPGSANSSFDMRTWHAVVAFQGWTGLSRTGVVNRQTWTRLGRASVPRAWGGLRGGIQIDTARQVLFMVRGGVVVRAIHVSTGAGGRTPLGRFSVRSKALMSWSVPFSVWMPYAQYFYAGFAMHSYPSVPAYPASHGCVRLPSMEAPVVYAFTTIGTPVWIR